MAKIKSEFKLPKPRIVENEYYWVPIVRVGRVVPFGYEQDPYDEDILIPVPEELDLLELAKKHLKNYSYRDVANWLSEESGRYITHAGLRSRIKSEQKRKREAANYYELAKRYKEAMDKAKKIEERCLGRKQYRTGETEGS
jgi:hypothetical protein